MNKVFIYTTKIERDIDDGLALSDEAQPHLINISCALCDFETGEAIQVVDLIVNTANEITANDFIANEVANEIGVDEGFAMMLLTMLSRDCIKITDSKASVEAIEIALHRYIRPDALEQTIEQWKGRHMYSDKLSDEYSIVGNINSLKSIIDSAK